MMAPIARTVVLADDHAFFLNGLSAALESAGFAVTGRASDGLEALDLIAETDPEVAILDVRMPRLDGVKTLSRLRGRGDVRPVILLANEISDAQIRELLDLGANSILFKHGSEQRVFQALDVVRSGSRMMDADILDRALTKSAEAAEHEDPFGALSERERAVAIRVAEGLRNRAIGELLGVSEGTIKVYLHAIFSKLKISSRTELALLAKRADLQ